jgi:TPR repeat protein
MIKEFLLCACFLGIGLSSAAVEKTTDSTIAQVKNGIALFKKEQFKKCASELEEAAEMGNGAAQFFAGMAYHRVNKDSEAKKFLIMAINNKSIPEAYVWINKKAQVNLDKINKFQEDAIKNLKDLVDSQEMPPQLEIIKLRKFYFEEKDMVNFVKYSLVEAEKHKGHRALLEVGTLYAEQNDIPNAKKYFKEAANKGSAVGQFRFGKLLYETPTRETVEAFHILKEVFHRNILPFGAFEVSISFYSQVMERNLAQAIPFWQRFITNKKPDMCITEDSWESNLQWLRTTCGERDHVIFTESSKKLIEIKGILSFEISGQLSFYYLTIGKKELADQYLKKYRLDRSISEKVYSYENLPKK